MINLKSIKKGIVVFGLSLFLNNIAYNCSAQTLNESTVKELFKIAKVYISIPEMKQSYVITDAYHDKSSGIDFIYIQQTCKGIKVFNAIKTIAIKEGKLAYSSGRFVSQIDKKASNTLPAITASNAITKAAAFLKLKAPVNLEITQDLFTQKNKYIFTDGGIARKKIEVELLWVSTDDFNTVKLSWNVNIDDKNSSDWWNVRINAHDGTYIEKNNWTVSCNFSTTQNNKTTAEISNPSNEFKQLDFGGNVHKLSALPPLNVTSASYYVLPYPVENLNLGTMTTETNPWMKAGAGNNVTTYGWNYNGVTNYNITRGNNVWAYDDSLNINAPGRFDTSTTAVPTLTFPLVPNFKNVPTTTTNRRAATTNLFYWNNILHDIVYQYGFDESAGNFQYDNMGRGGLGNDAVRAEAQDGSGTNNANFATPPDGDSGRMQMYLWTSTTPGRDGDFDNGVMSHEFEHGVSTRLTGGPSQSSCLYNAEQGGEGWSDYNALMCTTNWATAKLTDGTVSRPLGNYVVGQAQTGVGIRTYPYTTNIAVDKHTYTDVANKTQNGEVHYIGEVWCSALWDMTWNIIQQEGIINPNLYDANGGGGNTIAMKLVMQGLKLQPCNPGFLDGRNAILAADSILYNNKHKCAIWAAFARRGMGFSASQGSPFLITDQKPATDIPTGVIFPIKYDPIIVKHNQTITIPLKTNCNCAAPIHNYTIKAVLPNGISYTAGTGTATGSTVSFTPIKYLTSNVTDSEVLTISATALGCNIDSVINDNRDSRLIGGLANKNITCTSSWQTSTSFSYSPTHSWQAIDDTTITTFSLNSNAFTPASLSILSFEHLYELENTEDGAIVEYSINGGTTWTDAKPLFIKNTYNAKMDSTSVSAIPNQFAFTGTSNSKFVHSLINLSSLSGKSTQIRFRVNTDQGNGNGIVNAGWILDDISVANGCGGIIKLMAYDSANKLRDSASVPIFIIPSYDIQGNVKTPKGQVIKGANVHINGTILDSTKTDINGNYNFPLLSAGNYNLNVTKNNDTVRSNGVNSLDIALIQSHILGKNLLNSPYKIIAADVNGDGKVNSLDIVYLKRLILGLDTVFTNSTTKQNRLWVFVDSSYKIPDITNPFPIKDSISFIGLSADQLNQSFIGIKLGDVNWDWNPAVSRRYKPVFIKPENLEISQ